jgi:hypothetical protein
MSRRSPESAFTRVLDALWGEGGLGQRATAWQATLPPQFERSILAKRYQAQQGLGITGSATIPPIISGAPTSIALFVGWSPSGPTDQVLRLSSFLEFEQKFGGLDTRSPLGYAIRHFYDNGGAHAWVLRIVGADGGVIAPSEPAFVQAINAAFAPDGPVDRTEMFNLICVPGLTDAAATAMLQARPWRAAPS